MIKKILFIGLAFVFFTEARAVWAKELDAAAIQAVPVSEIKSIQPGRPFWLGLKMKMAEGWHIYWINPGDAGLATHIDWQLPRGFIAGPTHWPFPQKFNEGGLTTYGYAGKEVFLTQITPFLIAQEQDVTFRARVNWLACREICVPGEADVSFTLPIKDEWPHIDKKKKKFFLRTMKRWPIPQGLGTAWQVAAYEQDAFLVLDVVSPHEKFSSFGQLIFFPERNDLLDHGGEQKIKKIKNGYQLWLSKSTLFKENTKSIKGVLVCDKSWDKKNPRRALEVDVPLSRKE